MGSKINFLKPATSGHTEVTSVIAGKWYEYEWVKRFMGCPEKVNGLSIYGPSLAILSLHLFRCISATIGLDFNFNSAFSDAKVALWGPLRRAQKWTVKSCSIGHSCFGNGGDWIRFIFHSLGMCLLQREMCTAVVVKFAMLVKFEHFQQLGSTDIYCKRCLHCHLLFWKAWGSIRCQWRL